MKEAQILNNIYHCALFNKYFAKQKTHGLHPYKWVIGTTEGICTSVQALLGAATRVDGVHQQHKPTSATYWSHASPGSQPWLANGSSTALGEEGFSPQMFVFEE